MLASQKIMGKENIKVMTHSSRWQAAKDKVAKKYGHRSYAFISLYMNKKSLIEILDESAELYAQEVARDFYKEGYGQGSMRSKKSAEQFSKEYFK